MTGSSLDGPTASHDHHHVPNLDVNVNANPFLPIVLMTGVHGRPVQNVSVSGGNASVDDGHGEVRPSDHGRASAAAR